MSRRLLNKLSVSNDAEDCFITKLKVECGQQAIQKLASMFTDMALSDQLQEEYMRDSHHGSPGGVVHEVRVLQTNAWPEKADDAPVVPCQEKLGGQKKSPESVWIIVINIYKYIYIYI